MKTKKFQRNMKKFGMELKTKLKRLMVVKKTEYGKDFLKIRFESNNYLPMNKPVKLHLLTIRGVFREDNKLYPQLFSDDALYDV